MMRWLKKIKLLLTCDNFIKQKSKKSLASVSRSCTMHMNSLSIFLLLPSRWGLKIDDDNNGPSPPFQQMIETFYQ